MNTPSQLQMLVARNVATWRRQNQAKVTPTEAELASARILARFKSEREARRRNYLYGLCRIPLVSVREAMAA